MILNKYCASTPSALRQELKMTQIEAKVAELAVWIFTIFVAVPAHAETGHDANRSYYAAPKAIEAPKVDGVADDLAWGSAQWRELDQVWLGPEPTKADFQGRYKVVWTADRIFILGEFVDDVLIDSHRDPLVQYWDDDCLEIFIDEDNSGGNHQFNHNAFAYHISLDNQAIDIGTDEQPHSYTGHVNSRWQQHGNRIVWEVAIDIFTADYRDGSADNQAVELALGKVMGFMVAYCDNDGSEIRENFIGSEVADGDHKDRGWIDAGLFGALELVE
jgi:hypothetical protein